MGQVYKERETEGEEVKESGSGGQREREEKVKSE